MRDQDKNQGATLTVEEAVETLSHIADLDYEQSLQLAEEPEILSDGKPIEGYRMHWISHKNAPITVNAMKDIFRVILNYLRKVYKNDLVRFENGDGIEGVKTIMVLVGEAARKLDKFSSLFEESKIKSITELREFKRLQDFYNKCIDRKIEQKIDESQLGKWILGISNRREPEKSLQFVGKNRAYTRHVYIDLDSVKKDIDYELFFIRKEDGMRFFSPRLVRNMKLVNDFKSGFGEDKVEDPLIPINVWDDKVAFDCAKNIIKSTRKHIERFYRTSNHMRDRALVETLHKAFMGLMLAANPRNLSRTENIEKTTRNYFYDFQLFLREALSTGEYQHLIAYPPNKTNQVAVALLDTIHVVCMAIYTQMNAYQALLPFIQDLLQKAHHGIINHNSVEGRLSLEAELNTDYRAMTKLLKSHRNGPINKVINRLEESIYQGFDPLMQQNTPSELYSLYVQDSKCLVARWPSPVHQEVINRVTIIEEFKAFLRACEHEYRLKKCLVFNFQDRVTWKENARCTALEELQNRESFSRYIDVVTLAKDTEFYHQLAPYNMENHAASFIRTFKEQLSEENCGFYFPEHLKNALFTGFVDEVLHGIHRVFFSGKNVLQRENRLDFIEIFYMLLQLKIIELSRPDVTAFSCKDGLDTSLASSAEIFIFMKLVNQERLSEMDKDQLDLMLYGPCLMVRERLMIGERFNRLIGVVKTIEGVREGIGYKNFKILLREVFGRLYKSPILEGKCIIQGYVEEL